MKKFIILAFSLLFSSNAFAGTISIQPWISGNDVTIPHLETQRTTIQNVINGNIEGGGQNIKAGSINSSDIATAVNPVTFRNEAFNDWTYSGMLPATSGTLSTTISAGVSYVNGVRIETNSTAHSYTASKDTYTYINAGGFFDYSEVANGASAPSTPANDLLLAKVVTNGTAVTSVTDLRTTSIQITANNSNFAQDYRNQALVSRDSTTAMHIEPGQIAIGNTYYSTTSDSSSKSISTATNWIEGQIPTLANQAHPNFYVYAYNNSGTQFDFKYSSVDPVNSDTSSNTAGTLRYYTTGGVTYRALAWISMDNATTIQPQLYGNFSDGNIINQVYFQTGAVATGAVAVPIDDTPPLQSEGDQFMAVTIVPSNLNNLLKIDVLVNASSSSGDIMALSIYRNAETPSLATSWTSTTGGGARDLELHHYMRAATTSPITFKVRLGAAAGTNTLNGVGGARQFGGAMASSIRVTEIQG